MEEEGSVGTPTSRSDSTSISAEVAVTGSVDLAPLGNAEPVAVQPPVPAQAAAPQRSAALESEKVVVAAPMSFAGSAARIWKLVRLRPDPAGRALLGTVAVVLIVMAWLLVLAWYLFWGLWLVPYRIVRRGSRKRKRQALQHRELIATIQGQRKDES